MPFYYRQLGRKQCFYDQELLLTDHYLLILNSSTFLSRFFIHRIAGQDKNYHASNYSPSILINYKNTIIIPR
jgi:hypothetical protein